MSLNLFNLGGANRNSDLKIEEGIHYKILKDGHGVEHRILNFENKTLCPREGIVEIEPLTISNRHRHPNNVGWTVIHDKELGVEVGIPLGIDSKTKNIIWTKFKVTEGETLDLSIPAQAMRWAVIKRSHFLVTSPNFNTASKTRYKAVDKEKEAEVFELSRRTKRKAADIAEALSGGDLEDYGRNCGLDPKAMSPKTLWVEVVKFAEKNPEEFMKIHLSDTREELTVLNRGLAMGVLNQHLENGINYNGLTLGFNIPEALKYLREHPQTFASIDALSRKSESDSVYVMREPQKEILPADEANLRIAQLEKELAAKERALASATEKALDLQSNADISDIDSEFADLMKEAKQLGIKGCHMIKDKGKLKEKIEAKKATVKN